jgi:hypothetical protein
MDPVQIEFDASRRVLWVRFDGMVTPAAMQAAVPGYEKLVATLQPGFTALVDLTDLAAMDIDCVPYVTHLMDLLLQAGVSRVVRIIPDDSKDIGFNLLSLTHYRGRIQIQTLSSRAEAAQTMGA